MKQYFFKALSVAIIAMTSAPALAQNNKADGKMEGDKQIIIQKTGDKNAKVTVEIKDGEVSINGKPLSDFQDDNLSIRIETDAWTRGYTPRSPFRTGGTSVQTTNTNSAFLGVVTENHADGAKVTSVTKGSAAEKAGLKAGDVITRINDEKVGNASELNQAVRKFKPEQKVTIGIKRDNKTETVSATLGNRVGATSVFSGDNFDLHFDNFQLATTFNRGRIGIKAQDTEDEKGVKVLSVDPESHAEKSGIKSGDIIYQFDGEEVNSATELADAARDAREKNNIKVRISRDGKSQDMEIKIPKKLKTANL